MVKIVLIGLLSIGVVFGQPIEVTSTEILLVAMAIREILPQCHVITLDRTPLYWKVNAGNAASQAMWY